MFEKILIANRGEIACRVARTARRLGIATVAVYSEADAGAMHVAACDEAYLIGPAAARESYLHSDRILQVARESGAQAIHPGYGFLSENAAFARACGETGVTFIGPPESAIRAMGSKSEAKLLMMQAGVPLVPGYHGEDQSDERLRIEAESMGYPLLIKATAGGGGKGMRIVMNAAQFDAALQSARREAQSSFADDRVLLERYLIAPRHVELQIFADAHGNLVHLFERDCSIQRRHQKVLEEAPAPGITPDLRARMGAAAIDAAAAIGYQGAGTVEFLMQRDNSFYFMEMNTRLQVEHPVTEMISGQDLVEWQLRIASGEPLPLTQEQLEINGHAFEARVYAESPERDFLPATGRLRYLKTPVESTHVRVDTGVRQGDEVSVHYDPMIAKLIVWDRDRSSALRRMRGALNAYRIVGVQTNLEFLAALCAVPALAEEALDTGFIDTHKRLLLPGKGALPDEVLALAALYELLLDSQRAQRQREASADPGSPWGVSDGWRLNQDNFHSFFFRQGEHEIEVIAHYRSGGYQLDLPSGAWQVSGEIASDGDLLADIQDRRLRAAVIKHQKELTILQQGRAWQLTLHDPRIDAMEGEEVTGGLIAPMPGSVVAVRVTAGAHVKQGDPLLVVEAMKMEHSISAPFDGVVREICFDVGDQVEEGDELLRMEAD
ncbi:MAG: acetyl/propionyl/methylcrotonyl-CoA carboxylase subunit alpha [Chromatiaceae bacterium]|nr:acetyl/propionyl/methylcrotonyl-CoA carboxylase subunit alpha [Chromatiaceae bacterium]